MEERREGQPLRREETIKQSRRETASVKYVEKSRQSVPS